MNDELKYDHFENTEEVLKHIALWHREDDVYYTRWFGLNDLNNLRIYINQLQSNWKSLREWLGKASQEEPMPRTEHFSWVYNNVLDYMNELESGNK